MVKALHKAGIEVILDVVFNHTSEGNHQGPTINFKGFENDVYYHLVEPGPAVLHGLHRLREHGELQPPGGRTSSSSSAWSTGSARCTSTGSASTRARSSPAARTAPRWSTRRSSGTSSSPRTLADTKVFAEAWDAAGLYQIGYFPGYRWAEWNGRYRDDVRRFVKGDAGLIGDVASRIAGSVRPLPVQRPPADQQRQLHQLPRRLHAERPRLLQREAQRGQRRGQPRRQRRQR